ncbi:uncharacterized protein LOC126895933 [Daktulosphaira vitifoliae]|uniref:uncharacterized protein LOC126895933 n=1 Tax=Daktulosphaira vitifoliae TaxID=58002 RepID=UPI0021A9D007|nr:uncharacterized protein LOC126895933 [Daktulosphaira vitifoliae]
MKLFLNFFVLNSFTLILTQENSKNDLVFNEFFDNLLNQKGYTDRFKLFFNEGIKQFSIGVVDGKDGNIVKLSDFKRKGNVILHPEKIETWLQYSFIAPRLEVNWKNSKCLGIKCQLWAIISDNELIVKIAVKPEKCDVSYSITLKTIKNMDIFVTELPKFIPIFFFNSAFNLVEFINEPLKERIKHRISHTVLNNFFNDKEIEKLCQIVDKIVH